VNAGGQRDTLRIHRPGSIVAFGRQDAVSSGYRAAVQAALAAGYAPIERLAGGRAAIFHPGTIAFALAVADPSPKERITERFQMVGEILVAALRSLGVDAGLGEVEGEYCPGAYSVHARGARKIIGVGQRLSRSAAHVGGVVVVSGRDEVNRVLAPVYRALDLSWRSEVTGDIVGEAPGATWDQVEGAIVESFATHFDLLPGDIDEAERAEARALAPEHRSNPS
jgi:lipoate-protein ligase A